MDKMAKEPPSTNGWLDFAGFAAIATAIVYATRWIYAYHYFANFQLGLLSLDIPGEYHLIYGFLVLRDWWFLVLPYIALVLLISYLKTKSWWKRLLPVFGMQGNRLIPLFVCCCA